MHVVSSFISLNHLRFHAYHGVGAQEHVVGNDYDLTLRIEADLTQAMHSDNVSHTINYAEVYQLARGVMQQPCNLLERVAYNIADALFKKWPRIQAVDLILAKLNPPMGADCENASVEIHLINNKTQ